MILLDAIDGTGLDERAEEMIERARETGEPCKFANVSLEVSYRDGVWRWMSDGEMYFTSDYIDAVDTLTDDITTWWQR